MLPLRVRSKRKITVRYAHGVLVCLILGFAPAGRGQADRASLVLSPLKSAEYLVQASAAFSSGKIQEPRAVESQSSKSASASAKQDSRPVIYIFRRRKHKMPADLDVYCDGLSCGPIYAGTYLTVPTTLGKHVITASGKKIKHEATFELDGASGGIYYLELSVEIESRISKTFNLTMSLVPKEIGESAISKECSPVVPLRVKWAEGGKLDTVDLLIRQLKNNNPKLRASAAEELGKFRDLRAVEPLIAALKERESIVRQMAAAALGQIKDSRAVGPLINALKDSDAAVQHLAEGALVAIGTPAVDSLTAAMKDSDSEVRVAAAGVLGQIKGNRATEPGPAAGKVKSDSTGTAGARSTGPTAASAAPTPIHSAARLPLTDAQIEAAIQRGVNDHTGGRWSWSSGIGIVNHVPSVVINRSLGPHVAQMIHVFSDSDRIALAALVASHEWDKHGNSHQKQAYSFSVEDAKTSAVALGVITVVLEFSGRKADLAKWMGPSYHIALNADGKIIEPLTNAQYIAQAISTGSSRTKPWNYQEFFSYNCKGPGPLCFWVQVVFPVVEGASKLTVVTTSADGHRKEKEIDAKLFEER
jgi:hypothetical protein